VGSGPGSGNGRGSAMAAYLGEVRRLLERAKRYPEEARRRAITGKVSLSFVIRLDGSVEGAEVDGDPPQELASAALELAGDVRLPPPPKGWDATVRVRINLSYQLD
jgi:TonB family protein